MPKDEELEFISINADESDLNEMRTAYRGVDPEDNTIGSWIFKQSKVS